MHVIKIVFGDYYDCEDYRQGSRYAVKIGKNLFYVINLFIRMWSRETLHLDERSYFFDIINKISFLLAI